MQGYAKMLLNRCTNPLKAFELFQSLAQNLTMDDGLQNWREDYLEVILK